MIDDEDIIDIIDWSVCYKQENPSTGMWRTSSEARRDWQSTTMHFEIEYNIEERSNRFIQGRNERLIHVNEL